MICDIGTPPFLGITFLILLHTFVHSGHFCITERTWICVFVFTLTCSSLLVSIPLLTELYQLFPFSRIIKKTTRGMQLSTTSKHPVLFLSTLATGTKLTESRLELNQTEQNLSTMMKISSNAVGWAQKQWKNISRRLWLKGHLCSCCNYSFVSFRVILDSCYDLPSIERIDAKQQVISLST